MRIGVAYILKKQKYYKNITAESLLICPYMIINKGVSILFPVSDTNVCPNNLLETYKMSSSSKYNFSALRMANENE